MGRSNVITDPTKDFNACDDFFQVVVSTHIIAAAMKLLKMKSVNDVPTPFTAVGAKPDEVWMLDEEKRKKVLDDVCSEVTKKPKPLWGFLLLKMSLQKKMVYSPMQRNSSDPVCFISNFLRREMAIVLHGVIVTCSQYSLAREGPTIHVKF